MQCTKKKSYIKYLYLPYIKHLRWQWCSMWKGVLLRKENIELLRELWNILWCKGGLLSWLIGCQWGTWATNLDIQIVFSFSLWYTKNVRITVRYLIEFERIHLLRQITEKEIKREWERAYILLTYWARELVDCRQSIYFVFFCGGTFEWIWTLTGAELSWSRLTYNIGCSLRLYSNRILCASPVCL